MRVNCIGNYGSIGFLGKDFVLRSGKNISAGDIDGENKQAKRARRFGISVPEYKTAYDDKQNISKIEYSTKGDLAHPRTNAISKKHLKNLFKNFYLMDKAGIYHNDFDISHVFFDTNGGVEFDCFRYSFNFAKKPGKKLTGNNGSIRTPEYIMPSNENAFEEQYLGQYVERIKDKTQKHDFIKNYLKEKGYYHQKRADMLIERGFDPFSKTVEYENIQSRALKNPTDDTINYTIDKLKLLQDKRDAFTEWDEGGGACGNEVDPERRFEAINMHFDCLIAGAELRDRAHDIAANSTNEAVQEYFETEEDNMNLWLNNLCGDTKGMAGWTFNDTQNGIYLSTQDDKLLFEDLYSDIDTSKDKDTIETQAAPAKEFYKCLANGWFPRYNEKCKIAYEEGVN